MHSKFNKIFLVSVFLLMVTGFDGYWRMNGKDFSFEKSLAVVKSLSTGASSVYYGGDKAAEFYGHHYVGLKYPNALYQGFLAVHFDEMDSVLTYHSAAGRTNARNLPGDRNTFGRFVTAFSQDAERAREQSEFGIDGFNHFLIKVIIETRKDSSPAIDVSFVFEFCRPSADTIHFSNVKILLGYDGDIGNTLGGYGDDSCAYYEDDSTALIYVFDDSLHLYSGMALIDKPVYAAAGNFSEWHHTVNREGANFKNLDTLLNGIMDQPTFTSAIQRTDVMVYWALDFGTVTPLDTIRDTLRFKWVNGLTKNSIISAVHQSGSKVVRTGSPEEELLPLRTKLHPNYPNPFNPETTISFELDKDETVSLRIYNILGEEVIALKHGKLSAGSHRVKWDGKDQKGKQVASGIYFYSLKTGTARLTRKMLYVR
jgi:hypothetical protein